MEFLTESDKSLIFRIFEMYPPKAGEGLDGPKSQKFKEQDVLSFLFEKLFLSFV